MDKMWSELVIIGMGFISLAALAVIVSRNANTSGVIASAGGAFAQDIGAAVSPVTGGGFGGGFGGMSYGGFQPGVVG